VLLVSRDFYLKEGICGCLLISIIVGLRAVVNAKVGLWLVRGRDASLVINADVTAGLGVLQPDDLACVDESEFLLKIAQVLPIREYLPHRTLSSHVDF